MSLTHIINVLSSVAKSNQDVSSMYGVLYWGQSNCVGQGVTPPSYLQGALSGVLIGNDINAFTPLEFGVNNQGNTASNYGLELELGYRLNAHFGYDILIGKKGRNGAALGDEYLGNRTFRVADNDLYPELRDTGLALMNEITNVYNKTPKIILVMIQGWSDCTNSTNANSYAQNLSDILAQLQADGVNIVMNVINIMNDDVVNRAEIDQADLTTVQNAQSAYTYNLDMNNYVLAADGAHFQGGEPVKAGLDCANLIINNI